MLRVNRIPRDWIWIHVSMAHFVSELCETSWSWPSWPCNGIDSYSLFVTEKFKASLNFQRTASLTEYSKSALTDHANQANHTIDWRKTTVIDREQDRPTRWIKEAVHIRKEGHRAMNRDEGSYSWVTPTTAFLMRQLIVASRLGRTEYQLLLMKILWWDRNIKIRYKVLVVIYDFFTCFPHVAL